MRVTAVNLVVIPRQDSAFANMHIYLFVNTKGGPKVSESLQSDKISFDLH